VVGFWCKPHILFDQGYLALKEIVVDDKSILMEDHAKLRQALAPQAIPLLRSGV